MKSIIIFSFFIGAIYARIGPTGVTTSPGTLRLAAATNIINALRSQRPDRNLIDDDFMFAPISGGALDKQEFLDEIVLAGRFDPGQVFGVREHHGNVFMEFRSTEKITVFFFDCRNLRQPLIVNGYERRV